MNAGDGLHATCCPTLYALYRTVLPGVLRAQVDNSKRVNAGGGLEHTGEAIEVLALPFAAVPAFVLDITIPKSTGLMFGLLWAHNGLLSGELPGRAASLEGGELSLKATAEGDALTLKSVLPS